MKNSVLTFLDPHPVEAGRARLLMANREVRVVTEVPEWYWRENTRLIAHNTELRAGAMIFTYFTCEEAADGTLFRTVCLVPDLSPDWFELARASTPGEAVANHRSARDAWQAGELSGPAITLH